MRIVNRWKRKIQKVRKATRKTKAWFTYDPVSAIKVTSKQPAQKKGGWRTEKLTRTTYADPTWSVVDGKNVYGPVRDGDDWNYFDENGKKVFGKDNKAGVNRAKTVRLSDDGFDFSKPYDPSDHKVDEYNWRPRPMSDYKNEPFAALINSQKQMVDPGVMTAGELRAKGHSVLDTIKDHEKVIVFSNGDVHLYKGLRPSKKIVTRTKKMKVCGKRRTDGKKCRFKGNCPHHRNKMF